MGTWRNPRRVATALAACVLVAVTVGCEVPDPGPGDTVPFGHSLPACDPPTTVQPGCLPAPATFAYDDGGPDSERRLDVYQPAPGFDGPRPVLVYVHGGAWIFGSRHEPLCSAATPVRDRRCFPTTELDRGYVVVSIDYRLHDLETGANTFPAPVEDLKLALKWLKDHAADPGVGIDPERMVVVGSSAGGQMAALAALAPGQWEPEPGYVTEVAGFVALIGPADLVSWTAWLDTQDASGQFLAFFARSAMGCARPAVASGECDDLLQQASPLTWADASDPPGYVICGEVDHQVPCSVADFPSYRGPTELYRALRDARPAGAVPVDRLDAHASVNMPDNNHNPDWDLNLTWVRSYLDDLT